MTRHFPRLAALALTAALIPTLALAHGKKDKPHQTETYDLSGFEEISVAGAYELDVRVGEAFGITVSGHADEMENLKVEERDGVLRLGKKKKKRMKNSQGVEAIITLPSLKGMNVAGVATGTVEGIDAEDFELNISGVGELTLEGTCDHMEATVSGVGEIDAEDFKCKDVHLRLSGVGEANVYASKSIDAKASGVGEVNVYGNPDDVIQSKGMMSKVNIK